jgi:membrane protein insertase Oxa1/YidC/SpoIIIJ
MRLLISFLLTIFIYAFLIGLFLYFIMVSNKSQKVEQVYIHQAIMKNEKKQKQPQITKPQKQVKKESKTVEKTAKKESIKKTESLI